MPPSIPHVTKIRGAMAATSVLILRRSLSGRLEGARLIQHFNDFLTVSVAGTATNEKTVIPTTGNLL